MRPQPGNRFRFRVRERVVRASEAVRDDSAVAGGRQTLLCSCSSACCCCCWRADVPRRPVDKNHRSSLKRDQKKCDFRSSFSSEKFRGLPGSNILFFILENALFQKSAFTNTKSSFPVPSPLQPRARGSEAPRPVEKKNN